MIYNVKVYFNGCQTPVFEGSVYGMVEIDRISAAYPSDAGYEVDFHPDIYAYMRKRGNLN